MYTPSLLDTVTAIEIKFKYNIELEATNTIKVTLASFTVFPVSPSYSLTGHVTDPSDVCAAGSSSWVSATRILKLVLTQNVDADTLVELTITPDDNWGIKLPAVALEQNQPALLIAAEWDASPSRGTGVQAGPILQSPPVLVGLSATALSYNPAQSLTESAITVTFTYSHDIPVDDYIEVRLPGFEGPNQTTLAGKLSGSATVTADLCSWTSSTGVLKIVFGAGIPALTSKNVVLADTAEIKLPIASIAANQNQLQISVILAIGVSEAYTAVLTSPAVAGFTGIIEVDPKTTPPREVVAVVMTATESQLSSASRVFLAPGTGQCNMPPSLSSVHTPTADSSGVSALASVSECTRTAGGAACETHTESAPCDAVAGCTWTGVQCADDCLALSASRSACFVEAACTFAHKWRFMTEGPSKLPAGSYEICVDRDGAEGALAWTSSGGVLEVQTALAAADRYAVVGGAAGELVSFSGTGLTANSKVYLATNQCNSPPSSNGVHAASTTSTAAVSLAGSVPTSMYATIDTSGGTIVTAAGELFKVCFDADTADAGSDWADSGLAVFAASNVVISVSPLILWMSSDDQLLSISASTDPLSVLSASTSVIYLTHHACANDRLDGSKSST